MTGFYARWAIMVGGIILLAIMTYHQYQRDLSTISLATVLNSPATSETVRIQGMVKSGTLSGAVDEGQATFELIDGSTTLPVDYAGPPLENIRELKTMVLIGHLDQETKTFKAKDTALINNFGFVAAAYLLTVIALGWSIFAMSQRVMVLFKEIKEEKLYESENEPLANKE
jgi:cytochrome c-type biogenesis protein CcmE